MLEVLAPSEGSLLDGPCPACGCPLPLDPWHHLLEACTAFPAQVPVDSYPWLALGREFGVGYALMAATARYLPVVEAARALLLTGAGALSSVAQEEVPAPGVSLGEELVEAASVSGPRAAEQVALFGLLGAACPPTGGLSSWASRGLGFAELALHAAVVTCLL